MMRSNKVYIGTSLDGYIADKEGKIDYLDTIPPPEDSDMGWGNFMQGVDALVMGRTTFETVCGFDIEWPYKKHVFVLSNSLSEIPEKFREHASLVKGPLTEVLAQIHAQGHHHLYIDGGRTIQSFLAEDLIDEMVITIIPILLGGGAPLFGHLEEQLQFNCTHTERFSNGMVQNHYERDRSNSN